MSILNFDFTGSLDRAKLAESRFLEDGPKAALEDRPDRCNVRLTLSIWKIMPVADEKLSDSSCDADISNVGMTCKSALALPGRESFASFSTSPRSSVAFLLCVISVASSIKSDKA